MKQTVRIVVTGSECTGKSTLARSLAEHYKVGFAPEYLRRYFGEKNGVLTIEDAVPIAKGQLDGELERERAGDNPIICDTNLLSSIVYNKHYYGNCPKWIEETILNREYHHYLLCGIDVPWRADGQRDRPEAREHMQSLFRSTLVLRNYPFTELFGNPEERKQQAVRIIDRLLE